MYCVLIWSPCVFCCDFSLEITTDFNSDSWWTAVKWTGIDPLSPQRYRIQRGASDLFRHPELLARLVTGQQGNLLPANLFYGQNSFSKCNQFLWEIKPIRRQSVIVSDLQNSRYNESGMFLLLSNEFCVKKWIYGRILQALYHLYSVGVFFKIFPVQFER